MWLSGVLSASAARIRRGGRACLPGCRGFRRRRGVSGSRDAGRAQDGRVAGGGERQSRMGITVCNIPAAPLASLFTLVMTLITYRA